MSPVIVMTRQEIETMEANAIRMRDSINPMADYVEDSGYRVRLDHTTGDCIVCIEGPGGNIRLVQDDRYRFIEQINEYVAAMDGNEEAAWLAAAKPYVESLLAA